VAMEMDGMSCADAVVNDNANRRVFAEIINIPLRVVGVRRVTQIGKKKKGVIVIGSERFTVHKEETDATCIDAGRNVNDLSDGRFLSEGVYIEWNCFGEGIICTDCVTIYCCSGLRR